MQSLQTCVSYMVFAIEILSLHWGNISIDIGIRNSLTDVCFEQCIIIWEKQAPSCYMPMLDMGDTISGMRTIYWMSYIITHQPALFRFILEQKFVRVQYGRVCLRISCILSMYNQYKGCSQETNISVSSHHSGCYTRLWTFLSLCAMWCGLVR
jgi:hypothetical protein